MSLRGNGFLLVAILGLTGLAAPTSALALTESWRVLGNGSVDGTALGDLNGDGRQEIVVLARGGTYAPGVTVPGIGGIAALASDGTLLWVLQTGAELAGFPTTGDFDGDGLDEVVFCELAAAGLCHLVDGDGTLLYSVGPLFYPGMAASGPTALDINGDGADDFVVASWGGSLAAYDGRSGLQIWRIETFPTFGELFFGHSAVLAGAGATAIVIGGYATGSLYAFDASTGATLWSVPGTAAVDGATTFGSGPAIEDLDGDGVPEIVVARVGAVPSVSAYDASGLLRFRTDLPGADLAWMSPVIADVDPTTAGPEVIMQSGDGTLYRLDASGALTGSVSIGPVAWVAPSVVDFNLDTRPELVVGSPDAVVVIDGATLVELDRFTDPAGGLFPAPLVADLDRDGRVDLATSSWWSQEVVTLGLPVPALFRWSALAGSATHSGSAGSGGSVASGNPVDVINVVQTILQQIAADPALPPGLVKSALKEVGKAFKDAVKGDQPRDVIKHLKKALSKLPTTIPGYDVAVIQDLLAQATIASLTTFIERATAIMGPADPQIVKAQAALATAIAQRAAGDFAGATMTAEKAAKDLEQNLSYQGNFCPMTGSGVYLPWLCQLQQARDELLALQAISTDPLLKDVRKSLQKAMEKLATTKLKTTLKESRKALERLYAVPGIDPLPVATPVALSARRLTRLLIDDATNFGIPAADVLAAEAEFAAGVAALAAGDPLLAVVHFEQAMKIARP